jgi:hypothetical protein
MSGKTRNPERRCKICGNKCEKQMRLCRRCARRSKKMRAYFETPPLRSDFFIFDDPQTGDVDLDKFDELAKIRSGDYILASPSPQNDSVQIYLEHLSAPRRGEPEVLKPPRQETGPSPAILEGTR